MKRSEFAELIGVSGAAISKAAANGRLTARSVRRDERGRIVDIDPVEGAREWKRKGRLSPAERDGTRSLSPAAATAPQFELHGLDEVERAGAPSLVVRFRLDRFVAGAARALEEAGKASTPDLLRAVIESRDVAYWFETAIGALQSAVAVDELPDEALPLMWEATGREAVAALEKEARDGNEG